MGFGGSAQAMISIIKNNRNLLSKRDRLKNTLNGSSTIKTEYDLPKSTPETIRRIKEKLQRENKIRAKKRLVLISVFIVILVSAFIYFVLM